MNKKIEVIEKQDYETLKEYYEKQASLEILYNNFNLICKSVINNKPIEINTKFFNEDGSKIIKSKYILKDEITIRNIIIVILKRIEQKIAYINLLIENFQKIDVAVLIEKKLSNPLNWELKTFCDNNKPFEFNTEPIISKPEMKYIKSKSNKFNTELGILTTI